jgi:GntR family transcriptional regulator/MocR family aminotransferase
MILLNINNKTAEPVFKQVYSQIIEFIERAVLKPGDKLPSSRKLAEQLGVNRTTVYKAYQELWSKGYIESSPGSYSIIRKRAEIIPADKFHSSPNFSWNKKFTNSSQRLGKDLLKHMNTKCLNGNIDFASFTPDPRLMPVEKFRKCVNDVIIEEGNTVFDYSDWMGYLPLRKYTAEQMRRHSVSVSEEEILITNGCQNGIELILKLLVPRGGKIITEIPCYASAISLFNQYADKIIGIPLTENGMNLSGFENAVRKERPAVFYTIPNFHNPTGITTSQTYREKLLSICEKYKLPVIEDGFSEEMKYFGKNILPIKSMDKNNLVFYLGTFSKIMFPGLRVGWIAAHKECIKMLGYMKRAGELSGVAFTQAALHKFCEKGYYELHIKKMHAVYKKRMHTAINGLKEFVPNKKFVFTKPFGGYTIWVEAKDKKINEELMIEEILKQGVAVSPGKIFFPAKSSKAAFRISIAKVNEVEISEGIKRIGTALNKF